jgi:plasmid stabilization system protein ParE
LNSPRSSSAIWTTLPRSAPRTTPPRAVTFIREIRAKLGVIARDPLIHQLRPDIGEQARMANLGRYAILFRVVGDTVRVERIVFGGHDLPGIFDPR